MNIKSKIWAAALVLAALAIAAYATRPVQEPASETVGEPTSVQMTLEGQSACLPHKDQNGPQTLECALGLKTDSGAFYALDGSQLDPAALAALDGSGRVRVSGLTVPIEAISSDMWKRYDVAGIMRVERVEKLK